MDEELNKVFSKKASHALIETSDRLNEATDAAKEQADKVLNRAPAVPEKYLPENMSSKTFWIWISLTSLVFLLLITCGCCFRKTGLFCGLACVEVAAVAIYLYAFKH